MTLLKLDRQQKKRLAIILCIIAAVITAGLTIILSSTIFNIGFKCPFHYVLHWECPGCGGSRMILALINLDFYQAFRWNPFLFITLPIVSIAFIYEAYKYIIYNEMSKHLDKLLITYAIRLVLFGITRNINGFEWLLPTDII